METRDIRFANLMELAGTYRRTQEFCVRISMNPSYFSQIKSGKKAIGDSIARKVETQLGLARGYLDVAHGDEAQAKRPPHAEAMAIAYSIEALPGPLREQFKRLVHQVSAYCGEHRNEQAGLDVEAFHIQGRLEGEQSIEVPEEGKLRKTN